MNNTEFHVFIAKKLFNVSQWIDFLNSSYFNLDLDILNFVGRVFEVLNPNIRKVLLSPHLYTLEL